jgi:hypothetical protein
MARSDASIATASFAVAEKAAGPEPSIRNLNTAISRSNADLFSAVELAQDVKGAGSPLQEEALRISRQPENPQASIWKDFTQRKK